ncbi:hypothetical protein ABZ733_06870 [Streptomyces longwoodensis]|uniref:hypothetical protein n=1 Tax=Streptomyces longwoodensis TaxID=68231 RepID=UPI003408BD3C
MTDPTTRLLRDAENYLSALHGSVARHDNLAVNLGCAGCELRDRIAGMLREQTAADPTTSQPDQTALRRVAAALREHGMVHLADETPAAVEPPLSPDYQHPECGFHWHGRDGMDIPMRDGQPICPRCELAKAEEKLTALQRRRDEVGAECRRRGKRVLEQSEQIGTLERQIDEVRRQLGAEILRAGQAEAELRRMADETQPETQTGPRRGDVFEAWLKAQRDEYASDSLGWSVLDDALDRYRLHADTGTPLSEYVCEGQGIGDCECLEQPAVGAQQDGAQR